MDSSHDILYHPLQSDEYGDDEIRVLTLLPGTYDDPIDIKLTKHWIENDPTYEALSYVWGIEMSVHLASVNNILMEITENLDIALRHLRYESEHRFMWIDALCINQEDMQERNHQVQLMGPIYANATKVVIWLGPSADNSDYVMDCVGKRDIEEPKIPYFCHYVNKLLERPWFYRVWVVQEAALAQDTPLVLCGNRLQPLYEIIQLIDEVAEKFRTPSEEVLPSILRETHLPLSWVKFICLFNPTGLSSDIIKRLPHHTHTSYGEWRDLLDTSVLSTIRKFEWSVSRLLELHYIKESTAAMKSSFSEIYEYTASRGATNQRDRVYGLLGLCNFSTFGQSIKPDYSKPVSVVFSQAMAMIIMSSFHQSYSRLPLLSSQARSTSNLPSWVPDFGHTRSACLHFSNLSIRTMVKLDEARHKPSLLCPTDEFIRNIIETSRDPLPLADFSDDYRKLHTSGEQLGIITGSRGLITSDLEKPSSGTPKFISLVKPLVEDGKATVDDILDALQGPNPPYEVNKKRLYRQLDNIFRYDSSDPDIFYQSRFEKQEDPFWDELLYSTAGRVLFVTDTGRVGITIGDVKRGDVLAGLFGLNFPFVLRKRSTRPGYRMINVAHIGNHQWGDHKRVLLNELNELEGYEKHSLPEFVIY